MSATETMRKLIHEWREDASDHARLARDYAVRGWNDRADFEQGLGRCKRDCAAQLERALSAQEDT